MSRARHKLSALKVKAAPAGSVLQDGAGLIIKKTTDTAGSWTYRFALHGRRRDMGLGSYPAISLSAARALRDKYETLRAQGVDPISHRRAEQDAERAARSASDPTLQEFSETVFEKIRATLKKDGEAGRWMSPLNQHIFPKLGKRRLSTLTHHDIVDALKQIWHKKHPTAEKTYQRLRKVLSYAEDSADLSISPNIVNIAIRELGSVVHVAQHIEAADWRDVPKIYASIPGNGAGPDSLRLLILTALRSDSVRGARFSEIDNGVFAVPHERLKSTVRNAKTFYQPLSSQALEIIEQRRPFAESDRVFGSHSKMGYVTQTGLSKVLSSIEVDGIKVGLPHGFRSSFKSWTLDNRICSRDVAEECLGHRVGNEVERSYVRTDMIDLKREVLQKWADYVTQQ